MNTRVWPMVDEGHGLPEPTGSTVPGRDRAAMARCPVRPTAWARAGIISVSSAVPPSAMARGDQVMITGSVLAEAAGAAAAAMTTGTVHAAARTVRREGSGFMGDSWM